MGPPMFSLPPELFDYTGKELPLADYISWWRTCEEVRRRLYVGLAQYFIPYSKEAKLAQEETITAEQALLRTHVRRESFALAMPYSIALLAYGRSNHNMLYGDGILCYMQLDSVRILDVHGASKEEVVIDMRAVIRELPIYNQETEITDVGEILWCMNGILMMSVTYSDTPMLVVIDVREKVVSTTQSPSRIRKTLREHSPYFREDVITDGRYLVCVDDPADVPEWTLKCYDLSKTDGSPSTIALHEFLPREQECFFDTVDGWFYAICANEGGEYPSQEDGEEKLYYNCCRFPIDDFAPASKPEDFLGDESYTPLPARLQAVRLLRGFGKDAWKHRCEGLLKDETTGELFIVESASFPEGPLSDNLYRLLIFPDPEDHPLNSWETRMSDIVQIKQESSSRDHYKHQSTPFEGGQDLRAHVRASQSIIDITRGDLRAETTQQLMELKQFLHLHTRQTHLHAGSTDPDARSTDRGEWRFPPQSVPHELRDFLDMPHEYIALGDERSLVIMIPDQNGINHRIILVNFDSGINFPNLKYLALENLSDKLCSRTRSKVTGASEYKATSELQLKLESASRSEEMRELQVKLLQLAEEPRTSSTTTAKAEAPDGPKAEVPVAHPWFTKEEAGYLHLKQGFQFYPPA